MTDYTSREMMAVAAAREIRDGDIVFCGTGISMLAAMAAKHISAPNSVIFFETGAVDSKLEEVPLAVGDPRVMFWTSVNGGLADAFATMQNRFTGKKVVGILGAAQIDRFGNLNSTVIGDYIHQLISTFTRRYLFSENPPYYDSDLQIPSQWKPSLIRLPRGCRFHIATLLWIQAALHT